MSAERKRRLARTWPIRLFNRTVVALLGRGVPLPGLVLLETTGRRTGRPRRTGVTDGRAGDVLWLIAEYGRSAGYVRNLEAEPRVRVLVFERGRPVWRTGTAQVLPDDDARARQRWLAGTGAWRALNSLAVRAMGTELTTVRIDLDPQRTPAR